jgi:hypothetical protein
MGQAPVSSRREIMFNLKRGYVAAIAQQNTGLIFKNVQLGYINRFPIAPGYRAQRQFEAGIFAPDISFDNPWYYLWRDVVVAD